MTGSARPDEANERCARALIDGLVAGGAREVVAAPGSRSTPLVLAADAHPALRIRVVTDERAAGFFAVGLARGSGAPVVAVCTSGTAAANFLPSAAEADLSQAPVIYLTADRPPEARDFGAAQTIRQPGLLGAHVRWAFELPVPDAAVALERHFAAVGARATAVASGSRRGPVQLNVPFREPLVAAGRLAGEAAVMSPAGTPVVHVERTAPDVETVSALVRALAEHERGLVVCGPLPAEPDARAAAAEIAELAAELGWPLLADPLSGARYGRADVDLVVDSYDVLLRSEDFAARYRPSVVLRLGGLPTSKPLQRFLSATAASAVAGATTAATGGAGAAAACRHVLVAPPGTWPDPDHLADDVVVADASTFARVAVSALAGSADAASRALSRSRPTRAMAPSEWTRAWCDAGRAVRDALDAALDDELASPDGAALFEGGVVRELLRGLPDGGLCWVGNSMPVRDLDTFTAAMASSVHVGANRGANGIDGVLSTALGAAAGRGVPSAVYLGDLSFLHDLGGLQIAAAQSIPLLVVVAANDGGGIFDYLPQAALGEPFERLFSTPHGLDLAPAAALAGAGHARVGSWSQLREQIDAWSARPGLEIVEVPTDRARNVARHREIVASALARLDEILRCAA